MSLKCSARLRKKIERISQLSGVPIEKLVGRAFKGGKQGGVERVGSKLKERIKVQDRKMNFLFLNNLLTFMEMT